MSAERTSKGRAASGAAQDEPVAAAFAPWDAQWLADQQAAWRKLLGWPGAAAGQGEGPLEAQFAQMSESWQASMAKWSELARDLPVGEMPDAAKLREMFMPERAAAPGAGMLDATLQRMLEGPRYATLWDLDRKLLACNRQGLQRDKDAAALQAVLHKAWGLAFERFCAALRTQPEEERPHSWRGLTDQWLAAVNSTLIETYRSPEFLQAQRQLLRSVSELQLKEREIAEAWCKLAHLPSRSEVDELQKQVSELRRELRLARRAAGPAAAPAIAAPAKPAAKKAAKAAAKTAPAAPRRRTRGAASS
ncbi:hypothetical protein PGB34_11125 [Xenophilus arseniciresistens]|uniref:Poly(3-hydroxyalkanoate) polymerase subunit PhaE n=1 Tax=Xenophilus arseniciresistens TaxID=1283306 RepID=A0AAE3T129_9BURK|nr:poly(R)-hydroxyalkanoic acid synthase subunit PhaE [Xenophilus arseniciresistens]MDA7416917.1 hypothetical protein [Xenophilus arseniciresistens]